MTIMKKNQRALRIGVASAIGGLAALSLASCASGDTGGGSESLEGTKITVALSNDPPPQVLLDEFTEETGIEVEWVSSDWDSLQQKITTAAASNSYFADATNVDWSKVGQLGQLGWFQPLQDLIDTDAMADDVPQLDSFTLEGDVVGLPYDASFMVTTVNRDLFEQAGISEMPTTIDQYTEDLHTIKDSGVVEYPLNIPLAAAEGLSTYWYETTGAFGGTILDGDGAPQFADEDSAGYRAAEWLIQAVEDGLVNPQSQTLTDSEVEQRLMAQGQTVSTFSDYSGLVGTLYDLPDMSTVTGQVEYLPTPGIDGPSASLSNPDGIGIPTQAKEPEAAAKFIEWFTSAETQADLTGLNGDDRTWASYAMPSHLSVVDQMAEEGALPGGEVLSEVLQSAVPVFPEGAPTWYPEFSEAVYTSLNSAAKGDITVDEAIATMAETAETLAAK